MFMMTQKSPLNPLKGTFSVTRAPLQGQGGLFEAIQNLPLKSVRIDSYCTLILIGCH